MRTTTLALLGLLAAAARVDAQCSPFFLPAAPISVTARVEAASTVVSWAAGVSFGGCPAVGYWVVLARTRGGMDAPTFVAGGATTSLTYGAPPLARLFVRVYAVDERGRLSPPSSEVTIEPPVVCQQPPDAPRDFAITIAAEGFTPVYEDLTLRWIVPSTGCRPETVEILAGPASNLYTFTAYFDLATRTELVAATRAIPPGTYYLRVRTRNAYGFSTASNEAVLTVVRQTPC